MANRRSKRNDLSNHGIRTPDVHCWHDGDDALCVTIKAARPSITADVLASFIRAIEIAEADFEMLIIGADQPDFAYGADLGDALVAAARPLHRPPSKDPTIRVGGADALEFTREAAVSGTLTAHQLRINDHVAQVLCGGGGPLREVTEKTGTVQP